MPQVQRHRRPGGRRRRRPRDLRVKLWDTEEALRADPRRWSGPETTIISFQNGVLKDDYLRAAYRPGADHGRRRLRRHDHRPARRDPPDRADAAAALRRVRRHALGARRGACSTACLAGGIKAELSADIRREIWQKYVFLVGLSGTTTTMRTPHRPDPREPADARLPARRDARGGRRRPRARRRPGRGLCRGAPAASPTTSPTT